MRSHLNVHPRDVMRCRWCLLVQFRTVSDHCRRCYFPLPPVPRLEAAPKNGRLSVVAPSGAGSVPFSPDRAIRSAIPRSRAAIRRANLPIGWKLRELREQRHLTQQDMADRVGVPRTYISRIENARVLPGPLLLSRIASALDVAILEFLSANKNGNGNGHPGAEDDFFWNELAEHFSRLSLEEMPRAMFFARTLADQSASHALVPELVVG